MPAPRDPAASMALLTELVRDDAAEEYAEAARRHRGARPAWTTRVAFVLTCAAVAGVLALAVVQRQAVAPEAEKARQVLVDRVTRTQEEIAALEAEVVQTRADLAAAQEVLLAQSDEGAALAERIAVVASAPEAHSAFTAFCTSVSRTRPGSSVAAGSLPSAESSTTTSPGPCTAV